jgi:TetR/AcrR family transcriptional regulator, repressor of the ameABC operon
MTRRSHVSANDRAILAPRYAAPPRATPDGLAHFLPYAVGERWFSGIEGEAATIANSKARPARQLVDFVIRQYELKRARYLDDPALFSAYLELGLANMAIVERHLARLHGYLLTIMHRCSEHDLLGGRTPASAAALVESMTARFRDPVQIMRFIDEDSSARAAEAARVILAGLSRTGRSKR